MVKIVSRHLGPDDPIFTGRFTTSSPKHYGKPPQKDPASNPGESAGSPGVSDELVEAYQQTRYKVFAQPPFELRIGEPSAELLTLFEEIGTATAAFLTAYNPYSEPQDDEINKRAQERLRQTLKDGEISFVEGIGEDVSGEWPGEPSFLAFDITEEHAVALGRLFGQNALLWMEGDAVPQLRLLV